MKIYLIRHTQPDIEKGICYGISDLDVTDSFKTEAAVVKKMLPALNERTKVFSSPLQRCYKLAKFLAPNSLIEIEQRLIEISFGDWELKPWRSIRRETLVKWRSNFVDTPAPNGEPFQSVFDRAKAVYEEIRQKNYEQVFLVSHSGVLRAFLCLLKEIPLENAFDEPFGYGVVFEIDEAAQVKRIFPPDA